jgi:hypothetical protein
MKKLKLLFIRVFENVKLTFFYLLPVIIFLIFCLCVIKGVYGKLIGIFSSKNLCYCETTREIHFWISN